MHCEAEDGDVDGPHRSASSLTICTHCSVLYSPLMISMEEPQDDLDMDLSQIPDDGEREVNNPISRGGHEISLTEVADTSPRPITDESEHSRSD